MVRFGGLVTLNVLVGHIAHNLDKILVGRVWGADALGIYGRAYQLTSMPTENLIGTLGSVAFPALSRVQGDLRRTKSYFLKGYKLILTMALPITIYCALFADDIVFVLLGQKWKDVVTPFRLLSPLILVFALINPLGWLLYSLGLVVRSMKIALVIAPVVAVGYLAGMPYGVNGVAAGYSVMMTLWIVPHVVWCTRGTNISPLDLIRVVKVPFLAAMVATMIAYGAQLSLAELPSHLAKAVLGGCVLTGSYLLVLLSIPGERPFYLGLIRAIRNPVA